MKSLAERVCLRLRIINMNKAELAWQFDKEGMKCSRSMLSQYLNGKSKQASKAGGTSGEVAGGDKGAGNGFPEGETTGGK
jgi:hypothetical protein